MKSEEKGGCSFWSGKDLFGVTGLELTPGFDYMKETAQQLLALTGRTWVPPMNYTSKAPFAQASYTQGPVTVSGGVRHEGGPLQVDDYTPVYFAPHPFFKAGTLQSTSTPPTARLIL